MVTHADLYRMVLCCPAMGCTVEALEVPRKMFAISIAPHNAAIPSGDVLHSTHNKGYRHDRLEHAMAKVLQTDANP